MIETVPGRQKIGLVAEMPFADGHRGIALPFQQLGDRMLFRTNADRAGRTDHVGQRDALGVAAGHHLRPRRRADGRGVEAGEFHAFPGHAVQVRRAIQLRAERPDVAVAHVVDENHDEVRFGRFGRTAGNGCQPRDRRQSGRKQAGGFHGKVPGSSMNSMIGSLSFGVRLRRNRSHA